MEYVDALLVAKPGPLRDALVQVISSIPHLRMLLPSESGLLALKQIRHIQPQLVIIASNLADEEMLELVRQIKQMPGPAQCLVIAETTEQSTTAQRVGADACVPGTVSAAQLVSAVQERIAAATAVASAET